MQCPHWLFSHVDDPFLDDPLPREFVLYLRPSGPLQNQLSHFWQQSRVTCGKNKAHNIFPHITLCQFFMCADHKAEALGEALMATVQQWRGRFPSPLPLELYTSSNFIGLFVEEQVADILKQFAADFATEAARKAEVHVEPHKKQLHVTLAYNFPTNHLPSLEKLAKGIEVKLGCDWLAVLFSRDIRFANHETLRVMYPYLPQNEDELELVPGDFVFTSPVDQSSTSEGWVYGTSLASGLSGLLPENYVSLADESDTWVFHGSHSFFSCGPSDRTSKERGMFDGLLDSRRPDNTSPGDPPTLSLICHPMQQVLRISGSHSRQPKRTLFVCRHGERMDVVFGKHWLSLCSDSKGRYVRSNLNMPPSLPLWGDKRDYDMDAPITVFGSTQARLIVIDYVYCSPSLRCVQTAQNILRGLQQDGKLKVRVEPGLFEWTKWVSGNSLPAWIPPTDLAAAHFSVDTTYRPLIPVSKLTVSEPYETYMSRSYQVTKDILSDCKNTGNNVLIVAHASSLEACTRQLQGRGPQSAKDFIQVVRKAKLMRRAEHHIMSQTADTEPPRWPIAPDGYIPNSVIRSWKWKGKGFAKMDSCNDNFSALLYVGEASDEDEDEDEDEDADEDEDEDMNSRIFWLTDDDEEEEKEETEKEDEKKNKKQKVEKTEVGVMAREDEKKEKKQDKMDRIVLVKQTYDIHDENTLQNQMKPDGVSTTFSSRKTVNFM
ncbi:Ubiquitin-associated and SH3 domain-containing protein B [Collichthys lucidus]|uniref:Ubiquitin-associated and SH3 domain-containing protein B n=1 Tax=Collichthys lucidus TaxID=240159 RepID=A0A4U5V219_COLLU|nr:Ubiquitin-associated and SH3 domain-containing protein B [Collichthys lucidus]